MINKKQEKEITELKAKSLNLEVRGAKEEEKLDALEQYGRKQNLEIVGIPIRHGENTNEIVKEVAQLIKFKLTNDQILRYIVFSLSQTALSLEVKLHLKLPFPLSYDL